MLQKAESDPDLAPDGNDAEFSHSLEGGDPSCSISDVSAWIPAFARMTIFIE
jgi:hypothetical protein